MLGWCSSGFHAYYEGEWSKPCPGTVKKVAIEDRKKRGQNSAVVVDLGETECDCVCHQGKKPRKNAATPKRKKK